MPEETEGAIRAARFDAIAHSFSRRATARGFFTVRSATEAISPKPVPSEYWQPTQLLIHASSLATKAGASDLPPRSACTEGDEVINVEHWDWGGVGLVFVLLGGRYEGWVPVLAGIGVWVLVASILA